MDREGKESRYGERVCTPANHWHSTRYLQSTYNEWTQSLRADPRGQTKLLWNNIHKWNLQDQWLSKYKNIFEVHISVNFYLADSFLPMKENSLAVPRHFNNSSATNCQPNIRNSFFFLPEKKISITVTLCWTVG